VKITKKGIIYTADIMHERGIYFTDGSFESESQVKRKLALEGQPPPLFETSTTSPTLNDYLNASKKRAEQMRELSSVKEATKIHLPTTSTINIISDVHLGNPNTNVERFQQELNVILNTPNSYILFMGDLVDGIFWGGASGAEQSLNLNEQYGLLRNLFKETKGKVIAGVSAEHDSKWVSNTGGDPYEMMEELTGAPYLRGVGEISLGVGDQEYKVVVAHKMRGHSMYNKNHPTYRQSRFDLQGADLYVSAHTHQKQISQESIRQFGGANIVTHISTGTYKEGDVYGDRIGLGRQKPEQMFGAAVRLHSDKKLIEANYDILEAARIWPW
jgi:hypothetical protein